MKNLLYFVLMICVLAACKKDQSINKFAANEAIAQIGDLQDKRSSQELISYFSNEDAAIRKEAALAFASIQDSTAVADLSKLLLNDADTAVRKAAAFALGQTASRASETALKDALPKEKDNGVADVILEAYGKVTKNWDLGIDAESFPTGVAWSLYRAGLNGVVDSTKNQIAEELLNEKRSLRTRIGAANFFARGAKKIANSFSAIANSAQKDDSPDVRMATTLALRKILTDSSFQTLENIFNNDNDYRVRISAVRALQSFPFERSKNYFLKGLDDKNVNVGIACAEAINATITENFWIDVANRADEIKNFRIQAILYDAILKVNENKSIVEEIKTLYSKSSNPYQKSALLGALSNHVASYEFIEQELLKADTAVVKSSAADALVSINQNKKFKAEWKKHFADVYKQAIQAGDAAVISFISLALADSTLGYREVIKDYTFLNEAKSKLSLPKDNEILQALESAIAHFERKKAVPVKNEFNHPIDWNFVKTIPSDQQAIIYTSKGKITLRLFVDESPGSVANFISLAERKFYDNKLFHRVVPNFVAQGGCPRGDGYGGEDYSIRSEFSPRKYTTGSVGMASAGKDTEGTQWFITHSPVPHLDGRYTIFAEVISGMEAVHQLEVGDQITKVEIVKTKP